MDISFLFSFVWMEKFKLRTGEWRKMIFLQIRDGKLFSNLVFLFNLLSNQTTENGENLFPGKCFLQNKQSHSSLSLFLVWSACIISCRSKIQSILLYSSSICAKVKVIMKNNLPKLFFWKIMTWDVIFLRVDDGFAWRKYGQKGILSAKYPRYAS